MIDKTDFSVGTNVDPHSSFKPLPDWVAFDLCHAYPVQGGNFLLHNTLNGKRCMAMPEVYASLLRAVEFKTIDQHTSEIIEQNPGMQDQKAAINKVFEQMLRTGMLVSAKATCERLTTQVEITEAENTDPVVAILTWERPQALQRLLESIVKNCDTKSIHRLYVIDDSRKQESIDKNKELVEGFLSKIEIPLEYFGRDEQTSLMDGLAQKLPDHEDSIHFLIDHAKWQGHWTSGLSRNLALLLSCGRRLVMLDDDTICDVYEPPQAKPNITFSDSAREADFFANEEGWAHLHQPINPDPIQRHMRCLGLPMSEALEVLGKNNLKPAGLGNATALQVSELKPESPVLMTECGSLGCPGSSNNTWLPDMAPQSLQELLQSETKTNNALNYRKVWSGRNHPHFAPRSNMSPITGLDNREMLPPYFPILRGEDKLFGYVLDFIFPSSVTLDYPWAVPHLPIPEREWRDEDRDFTLKPSFPLFFLDKILEHKSSCVAQTPLKRLEALSAWFIDLAGASVESQTRLYRDSLLRATANQLEHFDGLLSSADPVPTDWRKYLEKGFLELQANLDRVSRPDFPLKGLPRDLEGTELVEFWKKAWTGYAAALIAWPEIREAAKNLIDVKYTGSL
jgi:hypothetical protein